MNLFKSIVIPSMALALSQAPAVAQEFVTTDEELKALWSNVETLQAELAALQSQVAEASQDAQDAKSASADIDTLKREHQSLSSSVDDALSKMEGVESNRVRVDSRKWTSTGEGSSATWSDIPIERMELTVSVEEEEVALLVLAEISRVQHQDVSKNTAYRIVVDNEEIALTNTGTHDGFNFSAVSFHGFYDRARKGRHVVRVEYKTQAYRERWPSDGNGAQFRRLTVVQIPL